MAVFAKKGYHGATLAEIAENANVSSSLLIVNFGSKEEIFVKIYEHAVGILEEYLEGKDGDWKYLLGEVINHTRNNLNGSSEQVLIAEFYNTAVVNLDNPVKAINVALTALSRSKIPAAMLAGQRNNELIDGNINSLYAFFYRTVTNVLTHCKRSGIEAPQNDWFMELISKKR